MDCLVAMIDGGRRLGGTRGTPAWPADDVARVGGIRSRIWVGRGCSEGCCARLVWHWRRCRALGVTWTGRLQVKSPGDPRNFEADKAKDDTDTSYKSTGLFADF